MVNQERELEHKHFKTYKPIGYLSQFVYSGKRASRKSLLGALHDFPNGTMSIGRLDEDSEGLLLLTTDGKVSQTVRSKKVEKEYYVQVDGLITEEAIKLMCEGVLIGIKGEKYLTKPCKAFALSEIPDFPARGKRIRDDRHGPTCWVSITITEGKFRQVRKMTAAVGYPTLRLVRFRIGNIHLDEMTCGEVRVLTEAEVAPYNTHQQ